MAYLAKPKSNGNDNHTVLTIDVENWCISGHTEKCKKKWKVI